MKRVNPGQSLVGVIIMGALAWWVFSLRTPAPTHTPSSETRQAHARPASAVETTTPVSAPTEHPAGDGILYAKHESEARRFLRDCNQKRPDDRQDCLRSQRMFVIVYVGSFTGEFFQIVTLADALSPPTSKNYLRELAPAVRPDPIEACAWWKLLSFTTAHNPEYEATYHRNCDLLSDAKVQTRLRQIGPQLGDRSKPPSGWVPNIPGLVKPPLPETSYLAPRDGSLITAMPNPH